MQLQNKGYFNPKSMITHSFMLDEINEAIEAMRQGKVMRCTVKMT
jgi:Zn-dependent alcohol dehydrogenase